MKTRAQRQLDKRILLMEAIKRSYDLAYHWGWSHNKLLEEMGHRRKEHGYFRFTASNKAYCDAVSHLLLNQLYRIRCDGAPPLLVFGRWIDGKFYSCHSNRDDYYEKHGISASDFNKDGEARHYWAHKTDCAF